MRIFITGATGVLGSRAVPLMFEAGHEVTAVGRNPEKRALLKRQGARAVEVDLFDPESVRRAVRGAEVLCDLATAVSADRGSHRPAMPRVRGDHWGGVTEGRPGWGD